MELTKEDLEISERKGNVTVRSGRGGKFRAVPLNVEARQALSDHLEVRPDIASDRVFVGQRGPLTEEGVRKLVAKYATRADLRMSHRTSCATHLARAPWTPAWIW